jgi:hypothetical protein
LADEISNALNPESGLPQELLLSPDSIRGMSVADMSKHVDAINAWRTVQMAEAKNRQALQASGARSVFKEYPEGYKWIEIRPNPELKGAKRKAELGEALKFEGDMLGTCVGGYCGKVSSGRSRVFSLHDPRGMPLTNIEVQPNRMMDVNDIYYDVLNALPPNLRQRFTDWSDTTAAGFEDRALMNALRESEFA